MTLVSRAVRAAAFLGALLLAAACAAPGVGPDGVWTGNAGNNDFNTAANWSPPAVPTGTATVTAAGLQPITFSAASTTLQAIQLKGGTGIDLAGDKGLTLKGDGLTVCCASENHSRIRGRLTGNITIGAGGAPAGLDVAVAGTIDGNVVVSSGSLDVGVDQDNRALTVNGTYRMVQGTTLDIRLWPTGPARLNVAGSAIVDGAVLYVQVLDRSSLGPFEILTADQGVRGKFVYPIVVGGNYDANLTYTDTRVSMTLVPKRGR